MDGALAATASLLPALRALIIDESATQRAIMKSRLRGMALTEVAEAADTASAREALRSGHFDIAIIDGGFHADASGPVFAATNGDPRSRGLRKLCVSSGRSGTPHRSR